jgi:membrane-associated phospholipid phosphatase
MRCPRPGLLLRAWLLLLTSGEIMAQTRHELRPVRVGITLGLGLGLSATGHLLSQRPHAIGNLCLDRVPPIDRIATRCWSPSTAKASDVLFGITAGAALAGTFVNQHGERPLLPAALLAQSALLSFGLTSAVKELARRPRPYLYNAEVPEALHHPRKDRASFWSGHTANTAAIAFTAASLVQRSDAPRGWKTVGWLSAATLPAITAWLRVRSGKHFPTDVLAGYAAGAAVGIAVPAYHRAR